MMLANSESLINSLYHKLNDLKKPLREFREEHLQMVKKVEEKKGYLHDLALGKVYHTPYCTAEAARYIPNLQQELDSIVLIEFLCIEGLLTKSIDDLIVTLEEDCGGENTVVFIIYIQQAISMLKTLDRLEKVIKERPYDLMNYMELLVEHS